MDKGDVLFEAFTAAIGDTAREPRIAKMIAECRKQRAKLRSLERANADKLN